MTRLFWDFFGLDAEGTARHYQHHLDEFFVREGLRGCSTGVEVEGPDASAWCDVPDEHRTAVARALRPRRYAVLDDAPGEL